MFYTPQIETYPIQSIRGRCSVALFSEAETMQSYLDKEDAFFYQMIYDQEQKALVEADQGEIRVGLKYQADVPAKSLDNPEVEDTRKLEDLEELVYTCNHDLTDKQIDQFLVLVKSVGTYARALDGALSISQPSLHMSAAFASRDLSLQQAMNILHDANYDFAAAVCSLVPNQCPLLCRDEMEEWSAAETSLFEEGFEKYEKDFHNICQDFVSELVDFVLCYTNWPFS